jgi:hypothetical protein
MSPLHTSNLFPLISFYFSYLGRLNGKRRWRRGIRERLAVFYISMERQAA